MAGESYKIQIGTELDTSGIDQKVKNYNGNVEVGSTLDTSGITKILNAYKAKPLNINTKLSTQGITKAIRAYTPPKMIHLESDLNTVGIDSKINNYIAPKPIRVDVELTKSSINQQIRDANPTEYITVNAKLDDNAISKAIRDYTASEQIKLKVDVDPQFDEAAAKISGYQMRNMLKVNVKLNKTAIDSQIKNYQASKHIEVGAKLRDNAIENAITKYTAKELIPVTVDFKVGDGKEVTQKINEYKNTPVDIPVRLMPAKTGFSNKITSTPVKVSATVDKDDIRKDIETAVGGYTPTTKMPVNIELTMPKDINAQVKSLGKPTEPIDVNVRLDESAINANIALFKPTATLGIQPDLIIENVDDQIRAYVPKEKIKVHLDLIDSDINAEAGKQKTQNPITVNVKLDPDGINKQIEDLKPASKVKVGVQLDFASHKDKNTKEYIQKGISKQIKDYQTKTKIKLGVELDKDDINQKVQNIQVGTPIKIGVELNTENVQTQIDALRQQLQELGNIRIDIGADGNGIQDGATKKTEDVHDIVYNASSVYDAVQGFKEADIAIKATKNQITNLGKALKAVGFNNSSIESITSDFRNLGVTVTNVTSRLNADGSVKLTVKGLDQFKNAVTYINNVGSDGKLGTWSETISSDINKVTENFNRLKSLAKDIGNLKIDIFKSDDANEVKRMTDELNRLQKEYDELFASAQGGLKSNQINQLNNIAKQAEATLSRLKSEYEKTRAELAKEIKTDIGTGKLQKAVNDVRESFNLLRIEDTNMEADITRLQTLLGNMDASSDIESVTNDYQDFLRLLQTVKNNVNELQRTQSNSSEMLDLKKESAMAKLNNLFEEGSQAAKRFGARARELAIELNACGDANVDNVTRKIANLGEEVKKSNLQTKTFGTRLKEQFSRYTQYLSVASVFMYATQAARSMFEQVKLIDSAMTELKKVTDETDESYNQFLKNAASRAKELGTTIDGIVSSTADFARLGYGFADSQKLAEVANIYAVVGDEIEGVEDATQSLVSTMVAFKGEMNGMSDGDFALSIVDKMNEVSNNFAISSGGIGEALQRSASSMAAANNTIDETIAMITAANEVAQNPEKVGKWLCRLKKWLYRLKS